MPHEILDQVMTVQEEFGTRVSNIVFMGMVSTQIDTHTHTYTHTRARAYTRQAFASFVYGRWGAEVVRGWRAMHARARSRSHALSLK